MTRNIGIKVKAPKNESLDNERKNPFNGTLSIRGKLFEGKVVKSKAKNTVVIQKELPVYFKKFKRYGRGTGDSLGVNKKIDVYISSLSKALGSFGGYVSSQKPVIDLCINQSRSFIYTSALPSSIVNFSIKRLKADREKRRKKLWKNTMAFHKGLKNIGLETKSASQIVPVIIGDEKKAVNFGKFLLTKKIFAQPIRFPTVKKNSARIRISITAWHTLKEIDYAIEILEKAGRKFQII